MGPRQQAVLDFIADYKDVHGYAPTNREIQVAVGLASPSCANGHLKRLEKHGYITRKQKIPRTIVLTIKGENARSAVQTL